MQLDNGSTMLGNANQKSWELSKHVGQCLDLKIAGPRVIDSSCGYNTCYKARMCFPSQSFQGTQQNKKRIAHSHVHTSAEFYGKTNNTLFEIMNI